MRNFALVLTALLLLVLVQPAAAQSNQFRDTRAHLGIGVGIFTYYGPIDLTERESASNSIAESDVAAVILGSFPIVRDQFFFRGLVGFTNFDTDNERALLAARTTPAHQAINEFLAHEIMLFDAQVVYTLRPGSRSRFLPYIYTGFGGLVADPFSGPGRDNLNRPGTGIPGPERSVFSIPIGAGIDYAVTPLFSFFLDGSYRFHLNYVGRNEINGTNPFNSSLLMGGIRIGLRRKRRIVPTPEPGPIPAPLEIPRYEPPVRQAPPPTQCILVELNTVYFDYNSTTLDAEARALLDANVEALRVNPECCVDIVGYTDRTDNADVALRLSRERAEVVNRFYIGRRIDPDRLRPRGEGVALPPCGKDEEGGPGCSRNRRVESIPIDCAAFLRGLR